MKPYWSLAESTTCYSLFFISSSGKSSIGKNDLASLKSVNRAIMQVINLCLTFVFIIFGVISLQHPDQMMGTELGRTLIFLIAIFWFLRVVEQIIFFKLKNWLSWAFLFIFLIGTGLYSAILL